jgi:sugar lactone lactonase YvrE
MSFSANARCISAALSVLALSLVAALNASGENVDFDSDRWVKVNGRVVDHLGRRALVGTAYLDGVNFQDGVIEVDVAASWERSYPGINFRIQSPRDYERFYMRPHTMKFFESALQYTPSINGIAGWQLYSGEGFTGPCEIPYDEWVHIRLEVKGTQARVFIGDGDEPDLEIHDLKHGVSRGTIGLDQMANGTSYFSNFSYREDSSLVFGPPPRVDTPAGMVMEWEISQPFRYTQLDFELMPEEQDIGEVVWQRAVPEPGGLMDIARLYGRSGREPDCVFARARIHSDEEKIEEIQFGYSDAVSVFFNGVLVFSGNSSYQSRDPSFQGIVGLFDAVHVPMKKGDNELTMLVMESFGGWGIIARDASAVYQADGVTRLWETPADFLTPETVVYDPRREVYYVSNYDAFHPSMGQGLQCISLISEDGRIDKREWVTGLNNPVGMVLDGDRLLVVERGGLAEIDVEAGRITGRYAIPDAGMPNDVAADGHGNYYVSDPPRGVIYRFSDGGFEEWLSGSEVSDPNGLVVDGGRLVWGNNGDTCLKAADLNTKEVATIANLGSGIIDGVEVDGAGNYIVSHWRGKVYRVTAAGDVAKVLDTTGPGVFAANLAFTPESGLAVIPNFYDNTVTAYRLVP